MAPRWWPFRDRGGTALTAAALPYRPPKPVSTGTTTLTVRQPRDWQREAFDYYDLVWLVKKGLNLHADLVSRVRLYVGYVVSDEEERPVEVMAEATRTVGPQEDDTPGRPNALTVAQARQAVAELDRLQATQGGQAAILHDLDLNLQIAGECNLVGHPLPDDDPTTADEEWTVLSVEEFRATQTPYPDGSARYERLGPDGKWQPLPPGTFAMRVWRPHPRRSWEPDSPMRGAAEQCDTLNVANRMLRAQMRSRTGAGIWMLPRSAVADAPDPTRGEAGGAAASSTLADIEDAFLDPVADEGDPAAVAPTVITMDRDDIAAAKDGWLTLDRPMDKTVPKIRGEAVTAIKEALPLPPEMVGGLGDSNHWSAAQITQNVFDEHVKPDVELACASLTTGLFRPAWLADGLPGDVVARLVIWYDPSGLVAVPDQAQNSKDAHDEYLISDERRRRDLRYSATDAPSDDEIAERVERERLLRAPAFGDAPATAAGAGETPPEGATEPKAGPPAVAALPPVTAAARPRAERLTSAGRRLAAIDRDLFTRLRVAAEYELTQALTRAGNRIVSAMPRSHAAQRGPFPDGAATVAANLGPGYVRDELGLTDDELLSRAFTSLRDRYVAWTTDAYRKALRVAAGVTGLTTEEQDAETERTAPLREAAATVFVAALLDLARARIYDPHPAAPPFGEHDDSIRVPAALVRESLARAGGADATTATPAGGVLTVDGQPVGLVANGADVAGIFARHGVVTTGWVWEHGDTARPFEPHEALDGAEFDTWDDDALAPPADADWLGVTRMRPGDHAGCTCDFSRRLADEATDDDMTDVAA